MRRWPLFLSAAFVVAIVAPSSPAKADPEPLDANRCWSSCSACLYRAKNDAARKLDCFDASATCCEANHKTPIWRACGCRS